MAQTKTKIEYRVKPVTRYYVTRYQAYSEKSGCSSGMVEGKGEFPNPETAYSIAYALCKEEHQRLGYPIDDERIVYPDAPYSIEPGVAYPEESAPEVMAVR